MNMMKINYKILMDKEIEYIKMLDKKPKLLLHACCAPCSSAVLENLASVFDITVFFYNLNITPKEEFAFRLEELKRLVPEMDIEADVVSPPYDNDEFESVIKGMETLPEGGQRCKVCYRLRIEKSVCFAKENGFDYVTTTLSISPYKNAAWLNEIGQEMGGKYGIKYLVSDFKKGDGYKRSCALSEKYSLYRQNYCGCMYSKGVEKT